ncbi:hypothetical protein ES288_A02G141300v1 [Gossypium darwinii]|uniref:Uncharacterized protein n=1 Tax=Gossypium darwinii TaxID=34276 RepID=A0A5D2HFW7_GOSDA|nr:hypothetical protein ES288_A02G141300v1 [Gossypium darwinii]
MNHLQPLPLMDPFPNPFEPPEHIRELPPQTLMATSKLILRYDPFSNLHRSISCPLLATCFFLSRLPTMYSKRGDID